MADFVSHDIGQITNVEIIKSDLIQKQAAGVVLWEERIGIDIGVVSVRKRLVFDLKCGWIVALYLCKMHANALPHANGRYDCIICHVCQAAGWEALGADDVFELCALAPAWYISFTGLVHQSNAHLAVSARLGDACILEASHIGWTASSIGLSLHEPSRCIIAMLRIWWEMLNLLSIFLYLYLGPIGRGRGEGPLFVAGQPREARRSLECLWTLFRKVFNAKVIFRAEACDARPIGRTGAG